jgi:hypothetical protein
MDQANHAAGIELKQFTYYDEHAKMPCYLVMTYNNTNYTYRIVQDKADVELTVDPSELNETSIEQPMHQLKLTALYDNKETVLVAEDIAPASPSAKADRHSVGAFLKNMKDHLSERPLYLKQEWPVLRK